MSCVFANEMMPGKNGTSVGKINAALDQRFVTLSRIEGYLHGLTVCT
ncbi:hypothetical protein C4K03_4762 [Pseudomonas synxantha]|uniref:Uncharacterized protein n=1 Tax=Pseudomonas synxantha TaxID=47883 RepID=A0A3G7UC31_9PSED|nr:hypothetical protein C4K03_4762 [Pseudomonas synxantha]